MGIRKNVFFTSILTTSNYIFPLLVYPYVSRVLGVTNIGLCNFIDNIINYFILISMMGITIMGNRQIAADRASGLSLNKTFSSIFTLNAISTTIALGILICCTYTIPTLHENSRMMWYGAIRLVGNFMLIEWFYKGLEDFKYITYRTIFVKCLYVAAIFIFVHTREDYTTYYLLTVLMVAVNAVINRVHAHKYVRFSFKGIELKPIIRPFIFLGIYLLVTSLCTTFNVVYLGFATNDTQVGYYTTAIKLYSILLALFTGITSVIMPRMSSLVAQNKIDDFKNLLQKTINILFAFSIPLIIFTDIYAPEIIMLISGPGYEGAIVPMRIVMPLMLIIGYEQILVIQCLLPLRKDNYVLLNASCGAVVSLAINLTLVRHMGSIASAIAWIASEFTILLFSQYFVTKTIHLNFPIEKFIRNVAYNLPLLFILLGVYYTADYFSYWLLLIIAALITGLYTISLQLFIFKDPFFLSFLKKGA